jgi:hypothetical protein
MKLFEEINVGDKFQYSQDNKQAGTKAVILTFTGFSLSNKYCFYMNDSSDMVYLSLTSLNSKIASNNLKKI